ncbi:MAG: hypothetical protein K6B43_05850 [Treponema sp.]|nr:hypothetical protein [Treponema sp.]
MKKMFFRYSMFVILVCFLFSSCVTTFNVNGDVKLKEPNYKIENMGYFDVRQKREERNIARQIQQKLMKSNIEKFGYFEFKIDSSYDDNSFAFIFISAMTLCTINLVGFPTDCGSVTKKVTLYLFDSNGEFVKSFTGAGKTSGIAGLYYDTSNGDKAISKAINQIFADMQYYESEINSKLRKAGANNAEKEEKSFEKIDKYLSKITTETTYTSSAPSSSSLEAIQSANNQIYDLSQGKCSSCNGTGKCSYCKGTGKSFGADCWACKGSGNCITCGGDGNWIH